MAQSTPIFVFGANTSGRHGRGAALFARRERGAVYGQGEGPQGSAYGIPTKGENPDRSLYTLPLAQVRAGVERFLAYAVAHPELTFEVTPIGCGLAGYTPADIGPMFSAAPANCMLPPEFRAHTRATASASTPPGTSPQTLGSMDVLEMPREAQTRFAEMLLNPPESTEAFEEAAASHKRLFRIDTSES